MEMLTNREAVSGKYVETKKVNKLSNFYMNALFKQNNIAQERQLIKVIDRYYKQQEEKVRDEQGITDLKNLLEFQALNRARNRNANRGVIIKSQIPGKNTSRVKIYT
mmetsp:Transcript_15047/g.23279  ORF Transcript_15047/g.23279 Transcript_15047/m.23279 type:complete len:107 (+) Transcript_15047:659-979(+)